MTEAEGVPYRWTYLLKLKVPKMPQIRQAQIFTARRLLKMATHLAFQTMNFTIPLCQSFLHGLHNACQLRLLGINVLHHRT